MNEYNDRLISEMNAYYSARAPWHDQYMNYSGNEAMEALLAPVIADFEALVTNQNILEIACGTGNWTQVLARRARTVLATDVSPEVIKIARTKDYGGQVTFEAVDAYALENVAGTFPVVFAAHWWSHVPLGKIAAFTEGLLQKVRSRGSLILVDMHELPHDRVAAGVDSEGNRMRDRTLPSGETFTVIKNFPTESQLRAVFAPHASHIGYHSYPELHLWMLICRL